MSQQLRFEIGTVVIVRAEPIPARPWWKLRLPGSPRITPEGMPYLFRFWCTAPVCVTSGWSGGGDLVGAAEFAFHTASAHKGKHDQA